MNASFVAEGGDRHEDQDSAVHDCRSGCCGFRRRHNLGCKRTELSGLWVERNSYYKEAGYCFKTTRAISYFGVAAASL
jgi:hypothetical protein